MGTGRSNAVLAARVIFWGALAGPRRECGADPAPPAHLFTLAPPALRSAHEPAAQVRFQPPVSTENFTLQTAKAPAALELLIQRHEAMNGRPLLDSVPVRRAEGFQRTLDLFLPPKTTLFRKNPNARRDPLVIDDW